MIRIRSQGLGQMPVSNPPTNPVKFSPNFVTSIADCAKRSGELFDSNRLCCVRMDPETGKPDPQLQSGYGWYCAQTTFGAPVPANQPPPSYASMIPSSSFGLSPTTIVIGAGVILAAVFLLRR